jgi:ATP-binding cassette subfamily B protein
MTADPSVKSQKLKPGTIKRIITYGKPYKSQIAIFLITVVIEALLVVSTPLLLRELIDKGVLPKDAGLVTKLAFLVGLLAVVDAGFNIFGRWYSARIGEGLIYDLRSQVFAHIQRQSIAFFTRTQTGALISRINSDVMGAQQAFTGTLSGVVSNVVSLVLVVTTMLILSWQITVVSLLLLPVFLLPTKWVGKRIQALTRDTFNLNATMSSTMTERFNVSGALLVNLYGKPAHILTFYIPPVAVSKVVSATAALQVLKLLANLVQFRLLLIEGNDDSRDGPDKHKNRSSSAGCRLDNHSDDETYDNQSGKFIGIHIGL